MTLTSLRSGTHLSPNPRRARARSLASALAAAAPCLIGLSLLAPACSDEKTPATGPDAGVSAGAGGTNAAGAGGSGGTGTSGAGGSVAGSGGTNNASGSGGAGGSAGAAPDAGPEPDAGGADAGGGAFSLTSTAVEGQPGCGPGGAANQCDLFPPENTGLNGAANVSPQLDWTGAPAGTQSFAIALHDLSNLNAGDPFTHWVMWNIPATAEGLPAELPSGTSPGLPAPVGSQQVSIGSNDGYFGSGAAGNVYEFVLFALSTPSFDPGSDDPDEVEDAIINSGDVLETATLRARSAPTQ